MTRRFCVVPNCPNTDRLKKSTGKLIPSESGIDKPKINYYSFPTDPKTRNEWLDAIEKPGFRPNSYHCVCSNHFKDEDIQPGFDAPGLSIISRQLVRGSVPSLNLPHHAILTQNQIGDIHVNVSNYPEVLRSTGSEPTFCLICTEDAMDSWRTYEFYGATNLPVLKYQLWNTFILTKVLKVSPEKIQELLMSYGSQIHPHQWFQVCIKCSETICQITEAHYKVLQLNSKILELQSCLRKELECSFAKNKIFKKASPASAIRKHLQKDSLRETKPEHSSTHEVIKLERDNHDEETDNTEELHTQLSPFVQISESENGHAVEKNEVVKEEDLMSMETFENDYDSDLSLNKNNDHLNCSPESASAAKEMSATSDYHSNPRITKKKKKQSSKKLLKKKKIKERTHTCSICNVRYFSPLSLKRHQGLHEKSKRLLDGCLDCHVCSYPFLTIKKLRRHLNRRHHFILHARYSGTGKQEDYVYTVKTRKQFLLRLQEKELKEPVTEDEKNTKVGEDKNKDDSSEEHVYHHQCKICLRKYRMTGMFEKHQRDHERSKKEHNGKLDCSLCHAPYVSTSTLTLHFKRVHKKLLSQSWEPSKPQKDFLRDIKRATKHKSSKTEEVTLHCFQCPAEFKTTEELDSHVELHNRTSDSAETFTCPECNFPCTNAMSLTNHRNKKHGKAHLTCELCGFVAKTIAGLKEHTFYHKIYDNSVDPSISTTEFVCNLCKETFTTRRRLLSHKLSKHIDELGVEGLGWKCEECSHFFLRKLGLMNHKVSKHGHKSRFICDQCGYGAANRSRMNEHMESHSSTKCICEYCSASYASSSGVRDHIRVAHPEMYPQIKKKYFKGVQTVKLATENEINPYVNEKYVVKDKKKDFKCKFCDVVLSHKSGLTDHLKSAHQDMFSFVCDLCDSGEPKSFMSKASLQLHQKTKHGGKDDSVKCEDCHKMFNHRFYLYNHKKYCKKIPPSN